MPFERKIQNGAFPSVLSDKIVCFVQKKHCNYEVK